MEVSVEPAMVTLSAGQIMQFTATVNGSTNQAVNWSVRPSVGSVSSTGLYQAPATISAVQNIVVTAQSAASRKAIATSNIHLIPDGVTVSPSTVSLIASQTQQFAATVPPNTGVIWSLIPDIGSISAAGLYTAPALIPSAESVTVTAANAVDPTQSASAAVNLIPVAVSMNPASASLTQSQTQALTATVTGSTNTGVTWSSPSVGTLVTSGDAAVYASPSSISSPQTVQVTAASMADPTKSASAMISLASVAIVISLAPSTANLNAGQTQQFTATVTGTSNTAVNWSLHPQVGTISATGLYTAPATVATAQNVTVTATSAANPSQAASSTISLSTIQNLATFQLSEYFGVAWPDQPIEFRYDGGQPPPGTTRMMGPNGTEVPYQWVSSCSDKTALKGCIAVRGNLPANANATWTLESGAAPTAKQTNPVALAIVGNNYEITNGLTGVRIVTAAANPSPYNLAPIQGIKLANGTWTGAGASPNYLYSESKALAGAAGAALQTPMYTATGYSVAVVDSGPMKTVLTATYTFNRPTYAYGSQVITPSGAGHYTIKVTMYANSKSILVDEDSDMQFSYYLPLYPQLQPTTGRWKGHDSLDNTGTQNPLCGYDSPLTVSGATNSTPIVITASSSLPLNGERVLISGVLGNTAANGTYWAQTTGYPAGQFALYSDAAFTMRTVGSGAYSSGGMVKPAYQGQGEADPVYDAFVDLTYSWDMPASYYCSPGGTYPAHRKILVNYPAANHSAGWYFEFFDSGAGATAPMVGMYSGDFSVQWFSADGPSMPGPYTSNSHWITGAIAAGIQADNLLRGPAGNTVSNSNNYVVHRNWGIFVSTQADLLAATLHQPIQDDQNTLTGINLSRLYTYQLTYPNPAGGWQWEYLSSSSANQLISWVQNGTSVCGSPTCYYNLLYNSETSTSGRALLNMWQGNSSAAVQTALNTAITLAQAIEQTLAGADNHFDARFGYYQLGLQTSPETAVLNAILMNPNTTPAQMATAKAALALFGCLFWDDDWFPIDNSSGDSFGLSNQVQQYLQYRTQSATAAPSQPYLATQLPTAITYPTADFAEYFSSTGAAAASTHYQGTFFEPLILNYLNFSQDGTLTLTDPKWIAYANWELSIQTPPEPRFGNIRKGYSNGDGNTEGDVRTGMLATGLKSVNPTVAGNLMWAWQQSASPVQLTEDSQFVTTLVTIDPTIPAITPQLNSTNIPGYHSAERHAFGTPHETAAWFINGGFYSTGGHRHYDDGQLSIYAHAAPLAIDWNANLYYPETPGRYMHDSVVYDSELSHAWSADNAGLSDAATLFQNPTNTEFEAFANSTHAAATFTAPDGTVWSRAVRTMMFDTSYPVIYVTDTFSGPSASAGKTLTWNMMATGSVTTPAGPVTPTVRFSSGCQTPAGQLPSNGTVYNLGSGLQQFNFTGVKWPMHATGGINWDLFTLSNVTTQQFFVGNWGHGCQSNREANEYQTANGLPFAETQHILRIHDTGPFTTLIMPYRKTETPARTVTQQSCGVQISQSTPSTETTCFNNSAATYTDGTRSILSVYDASTLSAFGVTASGGSQELVIQSSQIVWTISGVTSGTRSVTLPRGWSPNQPISQSGSTFSYSFAGGPQAAPVTIVFTTAP